MPSLLLVLQAARPGGAELALLRALPGLRDRGWRVTVSAPADGPCLDRARGAGAATAVLPCGSLRRGGGARAVLALPRARRLAAAHDVVHLNGTVAARLMPALPGPRCVLHVHDMVERVPRHWRRAGDVLADSSACAATLGPLAVRATVTGCPVDLPTGVASAHAAPPPWPVDGRPVVAFLGRLEPRKGPLDLVRAAPAIRTGVPGARVVLVGGDELGADPGYAARVRAEASAADVAVHPWRTDGPALLRHVDVLCVPSRREPFGTVAAEALAAGTPVVAGDVDGLREVVEHGVSGLRVRPGDVDGLAAAAVEAYARRRHMGAAGRHAAARWELGAWTRRLDATLRGRLPPTSSAPAAGAAGSA